MGQAEGSKKRRKKGVDPRLRKADKEVQDLLGEGQAHETDPHDELRRLLEELRLKGKLRGRSI